MMHKLLLLVFLAMLLGACNKVAESVPNRPSIIIANRSISLNEGLLTISNTETGLDTSIVTGLPNGVNAHIVCFDNTNVPHIERYWDSWILLVQSSESVGGTCNTRYKALVVRDDGKVFLSKKDNGGSDCAPLDRDRGAFTYLADSYVVKN